MIKFIENHPLLLTFAFGIVTVYVVALKFPRLIHGKPKHVLPFPVQHSSHRGGAGENPENTMEAFHHAVRCRTDLLELDVHLTQDGQVVVLHDANIFRISGVDRTVSTMNRSELPLVHGKLPIPTLEEVFQAFPSSPINLDFKVADPELLEKVHEMIVRYRRRHLTIWGSGFTSKLFERQVWDKDPEIFRYFTMRRVLWLYLTHYLCVLPFLTIHESALEIPLLTERFARYPFPNASPRRIRFIVWLFRRLLLSKSLFGHIQKRGVKVILWTPNNEEEFEIARDSGADGIMTDYPLALRTWMDVQSKVVS